MFVTRIDALRNTLVVGDEAALYQTEAYADDVNWMAIERLEGRTRVMAKTRSRAEEAPAWIEPSNDGRAGRVHVTFESPQRALTPGQAIVFYDGDVVVGGGTLDG